MTIQPPEPDPERKRYVPPVIWYALGVVAVLVFVIVVALMGPA